jgi:hypothetical protein
MNITFKFKNRTIPRTWIDVSKIEEEGASIILWFKSEQHTPVSIRKSEVEDIEISLSEFEGVIIKEVHKY